MNSTTQAPHASPHIGINQSWLDRRIEAPIDASYPIIDPHHHLWDAPRPRYLLDEVSADFATGHNIVASVFVECRAMYRATGEESLKSIGETEFANGIAAMSASGAYGATRVCDAIVGYVDLLRGDQAKAVLERHVASSSGRLRGIRNIAAWHQDPQIRSTSVPYPKGLLADSEFRLGFAHLGSLGLAFDAWLYQTQLLELADLAEAFPDTTIVVDHVGGPLGIGSYADRKKGAFGEWQKGMEALARLPNTVVKLGGLGMRINGFGFHEQAMPPSSEDLTEAWRDHITEALALFSPRRCMFESNFPVDKGSYSYGVLWNAFKRLASGVSATEKADLFHATAARVYGLSPPVPLAGVI